MRLLKNMLMRALKNPDVKMPDNPEMRMSTAEAERAATEMVAAAGKLKEAERLAYDMAMLEQDSQQGHFRSQPVEIRWIDTACRDHSILLYVTGGTVACKNLAEIADAYATQCKGALLDASKPFRR